MRKELKGFAVILFLVSQCIACAANLSVDDFFKNRKNLNGEVVNVQGVLQSQTGAIKLCQEVLNEGCINLEYTQEYSDKLKTNVGKKIILEGVYKEHEYIETEKGLNFVPSRISVLSFRPVNI